MRRWLPLWLVLVSALGPAELPAFASDKLPIVGVLWHAATAEEEVAFRSPLREGFANLGYIDGKTIAFDECYAAEDPAKFDKCATDLVAHHVDVLIAGSVPAAFAAHRATSTIPIVLVANPDPVGLKLVESLSHPGGNITGLSTIAVDLAAKRVEILNEAIPRLGHIALLINPYVPQDAPRLLGEMKLALDRFGLSAESVDANQPTDIDAAFAKAVADGCKAMIVSQNALFFNERKRIADLGIKYHLPTMVPADPFVEAGGLISYGPSWPPIFRNAAVFVDKVLKGAKPADLPVEQPTVFQLTVNLITARALGIKFPTTLLQRADTVIE